jgi:hypothetical protein
MKISQFSSVLTSGINNECLLLQLVSQLIEFNNTASEKEKKWYGAWVFFPQVTKIVND